MKAIISGGGIGGLTTALCFLYHGAEVTLLERSPSLDEVGAGIQVPPNAMKVFEVLGLVGVLADSRKFLAAVTGLKAVGHACAVPLLVAHIRG